MVLKIDLVVSAYLRYETNILVNNLFSSLFVCDVVNQEAQTKGPTFHFVSTQINRLKDNSSNSGMRFQLINFM